MPWQMQINLGTEDKPAWKSISMEGHPPYEFDTKEEAESMLDVCYPDQCREDRLDRKRIRTRVIQVGVECQRS